MIKFACFALSPLAAAMFCAEMAPDLNAPGPTSAEKMDREFLATMEVQDRHSAERMAQADRAFLAKMEAEQPERAELPVMIAEPVPAKAIPVRRAIFIKAPMPGAASAVVTNMIPPPAPITSGPVTQIEPPVRRAVPVTPSHRASILIYRGAVICTPATGRN
jgi:hypothetical protein